MDSDMDNKLQGSGPIHSEPCSQQPFVKKRNGGEKKLPEFLCAEHTSFFPTETLQLQAILQVNLLASKSYLANVLGVLFRHQKEAATSSFATTHGNIKTAGQTCKTVGSILI